jgi:hypothetical protein
VWLLVCAAVWAIGEAKINKVWEEFRDTSTGLLCKRRNCDEFQDCQVIRQRIIPIRKEECIALTTVEKLATLS